MSLLKFFPFSFWVAFAVACLGVGLASWLVFGLRFDRETSPGWQLAPYFVVLLVPLVMSMILGAHQCFSWMGRVRFLLPALPLVALGVFLGLVGVLGGGPYTSLRDDRLFSVVMMSASSSVMVIGGLALLQALVMFAGLVAVWMGARWVFSVPVLSRIIPPGCSAEADDLGKGSAHQGN